MTILTLCRFHDEFVLLMHACLTGSLISGSGKAVDHHYFYRDSNQRGHYSCGLARQARTEFLRLYG
jgi:hypothetical protein